MGLDARSPFHVHSKQEVMTGFRSELGGGGGVGRACEHARSQEHCGFVPNQKEKKPDTTGRKQAESECRIWNHQHC